MIDTRRLLTLAAAFATVLAAPTAWAQPGGSGSIMLRATARPAPGEPVRLRDVARIEGRSSALADRVLIPADQRTPSWTTLTADRVRALLTDAADPNWALTELRGGPVRIAPDRPLEPSAEDAEPEADEAVAQDDGASTEPSEPTVRDLIAPQIRAMIDAAPEDVRILFDEDQKNALLAEPITDRHVDLRPIALAESTPVRVTIYEGDRLVESGVVRVGVRVRRPLVFAVTDIRRGESVRAEHVTLEDQWAAPGQRSVGLEDAVGALARGQILAGTVVTAEDLKPKIVVRRGDEIRIRYLTRGLTVEAPAIAKEDGSVGDRIAVELKASGNRLSARVAGSGVAVVASDRNAGSTTAKGGKENER